MTSIPPPAPLPDPGPALRTALFLDFDNVFFSLRNADPAAAKAFADEPKRWLEAIAGGGLIDDGGEAGRPARRILLRRCYANPAVMRFFRGAFLRAGFQIVDCPSLTGRGKNSADISMVIDALELIGHATRFDEFVILSGDADFTPLLTRLRMHDRRTTIYANPVTASAYRAVCDGMIAEEKLMELLAAAEERPIVRDEARGRRGEANGRRGDELGRRPAEEAAPAGEPGAAEAAVPTEVAAVPTEVAAVARRVADATGAPLLPPETYAALFRALAAEVAENGYAFNRTVQGVTTRLQQQGVRVRSPAIAFVLKGLMLSGHPMLASETAASYAKAFRRQVHYLASSRELEISARERLLIGAWIVGGLKGVPQAEIDEPADPSDAELAAEVAGEAAEEDAAEAEAAAATEAGGTPGRGTRDITALLARIRGD
jgi:hypothetical protein